MLRSIKYISIFTFIIVLVAGCKKEDDSNKQEDEQNQHEQEQTEDSIETKVEWGEACSLTEVEFKKVNVGEVSLNVACKGEGRVMVLLHGFPEFWYGWNPIIDSLSKYYRLIIPDQRGYNLSDTPDGLSDYEASHLTNDIAELIKKVSADPVIVVAHDWGGVVGWLVAHEHPELVKALVILNAPHPDIFHREIANNPDQYDASWYIRLIQSPDADSLFSANNYSTMALFLSGTVSPADLEIYKEAWSQPGAVPAMLNWYRASYDNGNMNVGENITIDVPTLVLWGMKDVAILEGNLDGLEDYVSDMQLQKFPDAGHFIVHEIPDEVFVAIKDYAKAQGY